MSGTVKKGYTAIKRVKTLEMIAEFSTTLLDQPDVVQDNMRIYFRRRLLKEEKIDVSDIEKGCWYIEKQNKFSTSIRLGTYRMIQKSDVPRPS